MGKKYFTLLFFIFCANIKAKNKECNFDLWGYQITIEIPENAKVQHNPYGEGKFILIYENNLLSDVPKEMPPLIILFAGGLQKLPLINTDEITVYYEKDTSQQKIIYGETNNLYFKEIEDKETHVRLCYQYVPKKKLKQYNRILKKAKIKRKQ